MDCDELIMLANIVTNYAEKPCKEVGTYRLNIGIETIYIFLLRGTIGIISVAEAINPCSDCQENGLEDSQLSGVVPIIPCSDCQENGLEDSQLSRVVPIIIKQAWPFITSSSSSDPQ